MQQLPGRLGASTLGDLLGQLHRARLSGSLELREVTGPSAGRVHRIDLQNGLIVMVEGRRVPVAPAAASNTVRTSANGYAYAKSATAGQKSAPSQATVPPMHTEVIERLEALYQLRDAELTFHVARPKPPSVLPTPLHPSDFLHGRPRLRDRMEQQLPGLTALQARGALRKRAFTMLGLPVNASLSDVNRAFRLLALRFHPDRYPQADPSQKHALSERFAHLAQAYHLLVM